MVKSVVAIPKEWWERVVFQNGSIVAYPLKIIPVPQFYTGESFYSVIHLYVRNMSPDRVTLRFSTSGTPTLPISFDKTVSVDPTTDKIFTILAQVPKWDKYEKVPNSNKWKDIFKIPVTLTVTTEGGYSESKQIDTYVWYINNYEWWNRHTFQALGKISGTGDSSEITQTQFGNAQKIHGGGGANFTYGINVETVVPYTEYPDDYPEEFLQKAKDGYYALIGIFYIRGNKSKFTVQLQTLEGQWKDADNYREPTIGLGGWHWPWPDQKQGSWLFTVIPFDPNTFIEDESATPDYFGNKQGTVLSKLRIRAWCEGGWSAGWIDIYWFGFYTVSLTRHQLEDIGTDDMVALPSY